MSDKLHRGRKGGREGGREGGTANQHFTVYKVEILLVNSQTTVTKKLRVSWIFRVEIHRAAFNELRSAPTFTTSLHFLDWSGLAGMERVSWPAMASRPVEGSVEGSVLFVSQMVMNDQVKKRLNCLNASV